MILIIIKLYQINYHRCSIQHNIIELLSMPYATQIHLQFAQLWRWGLFFEKIEPLKFENYGFAQICNRLLEKHQFSVVAVFVKNRFIKIKCICRKHSDLWIWTKRPAETVLPLNATTAATYCLNSSHWIMIIIDEKTFCFWIYLLSSIVLILIWQEWINILLSLRKIRAYQKLFLSSFTIQSHSKKTFRKLVLSLLNINNRPLKV